MKNDRLSPFCSVSKINPLKECCMWATCMESPLENTQRGLQIKYNQIHKRKITCHPACWKLTYLSKGPCCNTPTFNRCTGDTIACCKQNLESDSVLWSYFVINYSQLQHFILTCNCHLLQTFVVLLCTELSLDIFGHEATEEYLENRWHSLSLYHSLSKVIFQKLFKQNQIPCLFMGDRGTNYNPYCFWNFVLHTNSHALSWYSPHT